MALLIREIEAGSVFEETFKVQDIILTINDEDATDEDLLKSALKLGDVNLGFVREGKLQYAQIGGSEIKVVLIPGEYQQVQAELPEGFVPFKVAKWSFKSQYSFSKMVSGLGVILGWLTIFVGIVFLFISKQSGLFSSAGIILAGMGIIQVAQISRALTDTADHTREMMNFLARK